MAQDLRTYLDLLIRTYPDQLKVVSSQVDPEFEATAIVDRIEDDPARYPGFPAVLFKNIGGSPMPLLLNLHATYERLALSIGTDVKGMVPEYAKREGNRIPTTTIDASAAPVQEVVWTGDDIDVGRLPMLVHNELDAGRYITSAATLMRDPDSGRVNAGIFRHQYQGARSASRSTLPTTPVTSCGACASSGSQRRSRWLSAITRLCSWAPCRSSRGSAASSRLRAG